MGAVAAPRRDVVAVLLAGGLARRMGGGDKPLRRLAGRPILAHVIERARPQCARLILNANGPPERFAEFGLPVVADVLPGAAGPLAGILTGLEWARANAPEARHVASLATDTPFLPRDLVARLAAAAGEGGLACARSGGRAHPVFGLWPIALAAPLRAAMEGEGLRKIDAFTARYDLTEVAWEASPDPFFNANRPEDLIEAEALMEARA